MPRDAQDRAQALRISGTSTNPTAALQMTGELALPLHSIRTGGPCFIFPATTDVAREQGWLTDAFGAGSQNRGQHRSARGQNHPRTRYAAQLRSQLLAIEEAHEELPTLCTKFAREDHLRSDSDRKQLPAGLLARGPATTAASGRLSAIAVTAVQYACAAAEPVAAAVSGSGSLERGPNHALLPSECNQKAFPS